MIHNNVIIKVDYDTFNLQQASAHETVRNPSAPPPPNSHHHHLEKEGKGRSPFGKGHPSIVEGHDADSHHIVYETKVRRHIPLFVILIIVFLLIGKRKLTITAKPYFALLPSSFFWVGLRFRVIGEFRVRVSVMLIWLGLGLGLFVN